MSLPVKSKLLRLHAEKLLHITRQHEFRNFELAAHFLLAWVKVQSGDPAVAHIESMYQLMDEYQNLGTVLNRTTFLLLFAQVCAQAGQFERGLAALDEAISVGEQTGERWFEAEAYRLKGELLLQKTLSSPVEAEVCFTQALQVASAQQAKTLELRAALSLARLWQSQGRMVDAYRILAEVYHWFCEGFDTPELKEAKGLLEALNGDG